MQLHNENDFRACSSAMHARTVIKGTVPRDFGVLFFLHQITPPGPLRATLQRFVFFAEN